MKLYKTSGVNPLGSCLPMFLQYPIIITLWQFLQQSIEIRQQGFLWANDLSAPDAILNLPFEIPFYGDFVAGFTVLMVLSMVIQMRLQPQMQEIKEKYKDNQQKQQEATMKLYKTSGVNPLGSCLPMFLQYPIIITLWQFLQQSIEIRQQGFLWANDLSAPDAILNLPFEIPFYGDFVAGFTVLMALSMVIQMRLQPTAASGMQAKIFMYVMPVFMLVIFNSFPSGLSLYYLCYNVITAGQQKLINNSIEAEKEANGKGGKGSAKTTKAAKLQKGGKAQKGRKIQKAGQRKKAAQRTAISSRALRC